VRPMSFVLLASLVGSYEFWVAKKKGIPTMDEKMNSMDLERGMVLISQAIAEMQRFEASTAFLEHVLNDLEELRLGRGGLGAI
jgi:hypothetical protein